MWDELEVVGMGLKRLPVFIIAVILLWAVASQLQAAVTVSADLENVIGTCKLTYGFNEVDCKEYFAGYKADYTNTTILQNHRDIGTKIIRIFVDQGMSQSL